MSVARTVVRCQECGTPAYEWRQGCLVIKARHHGEWHVIVVPLAQLRSEMDAHERELTSSETDARVA